ncbi:MAG: hypothetical protein ACPGRC_11200 [Salibacteraceae bacterium]
MLKNKLLLTFFSGMVVLVGCEKPIEESIESKSRNEISYSLDRIPLTKYEYPSSSNRSSITPIESLLLNPFDSDDEKISQYLHKLSLATRDLIKNPHFNSVIIELAQKSETQCANLMDLQIVAPEFYEIIDTKLEQYDLSLEFINENMTHAPVAPNPDYPVTSELEVYFPAIFVANLENLDGNLQPLISPNVEVDPGEDESIDDNIIIWFFEDAISEEVSEIIIDEETVISTKNPIFLLDNSVTTLETAEDKNFEALNSSRSTGSAGSVSGNMSFSSREYGIKSVAYRYEKYGKSEFAVTTVNIKPNGQKHWIYNGISGSQYKSNNAQLIGEIHKNQITHTQYKWAFHAGNYQPWSNPWTPNVVQNGVNVVFWNTFERDWNHSQKGIGTCSANGTSVSLTGNMKYSSEWYTWIPSTANIHYTRFQWLDWDWAHWNSSWKAPFRLWKVYI